MESKPPSNTFPNPAPIPTRTPPRNTAPWVAAVAIGLVIICCLVLLAVWVSSESGFDGFLSGLLLAMLPVPIYISIATWIDRYEPEPVWMLAIAFIWGATIATAVSAILNTMGGLVVGLTISEAAGEVFSAVISAPIVEETFKGLGLLIFFLWKKEEFDNITDGILYAAMLGLGFAMTENVIYYGRAFLEEGFSGSLSLFSLRGLALPFLHPLCTSLTGIGFGWSRQTTRPWVKWIAPVTGFFLAISLHAIWNLSATFDFWVLAYAIILVPTLIGVYILVKITHKREARILQQFLQPELNSGLLTPDRFFELHNLKEQRRTAWRAFRSGGIKAWRKRMKFHQLGGELAFHRWRASRGLVKGSVELKDQQLTQALLAHVD